MKLLTRIKQEDKASLKLHWVKKGLITVRLPGELPNNADFATLREASLLLIQRHPYREHYSTSHISHGSIQPHRSPSSLQWVWESPSHYGHQHKPASSHNACSTFLFLCGGRQRGQGGMATAILLSDRIEKKDKATKRNNPWKKFL